MEKSAHVTEAASATASPEHLSIEEGHLSTKGADDAFNFLNTHGTTVDTDAEKRVLRKIDWHIMPWLCALYFLQFLDKQL